MWPISQIKLPYISFIINEMKIFHCHSSVLFVMKSISISNEYVNYDEIII